MQVVQNLRDGRLTIESLPAPLASPGFVLIANERSVISAGTERAMIELARKSLLGKARARPDLVRRALEKLRHEGFFSMLSQIRARLDEPMAMGYSSAGVVLAVGAGVQEFKPGDRVASNGPHAGVVCVPRHLCARVPDGVTSDQAAFAVLGAIALQGVRLAELQLGSSAYVVGLGLVGQLTVALLAAQGCRVYGTDPDESRCRLAVRMGATDAAPTLTGREVTARTSGLGTDAVLVAAATTSKGPMDEAVEAVRKKGRVVLVGVAGLELDRRPWFAKEAEFVVSCSYGPGRYDPGYEERGHDYPPAYVRWTEQRNLQAVLDLMAAGRLDPTPLISHRFPIERGLDAYELVERGTEPHLGVVLEYPDAEAAPERRLEIRAASSAPGGRLGIGVLGAGGFARSVMLPILHAEKRLEPAVICSAGGLSAARAGERHGFAAATTDEDAVFGDPAVKAVFILTRHDLHAGQVIKAVHGGRHVFVEKPLAISLEEVAAIEEALAAAAPQPILMVGFNRRFSPAARLVRGFLAEVGEPLSVTVRFNAGAVPADHWVHDESVGGGRIVGEACHAIDLATFLVGAPPTRVFAESAGGVAGAAASDDRCSITLRHANGAVSSVLYTAGGDRAFPKERVEVFGGGRVAVIDDFRSVTLAADGKVRTRRLGRQDKGHRWEIAAFVDAVTAGGAWPIPWDELRSVSLASLLAVQSIREGVPFEVA